MNWIKKGHIQNSIVNDYEIEIIKSTGKYWATCFYISGSTKIKKFIFPPKRSLRELKNLVAVNGLFTETTVKEEHRQKCSSDYEYAAEPYWLK